MISYRAPGKIILSGEHSVVYTKPAFVTAIAYHLRFSIDDKFENKIDPKIDRAVRFCEKIVLQYLRKKDPKLKAKDFKYEINSNIPAGRGMGSSAAFCVGTVASLLHFYTGHTHKKEIINSLAYLCEKYFHKMPSGVDVSASCFGGLIFYRKEFEFLKNISALNFKIPKSFTDRLVLIDTGQPEETTGEMIKIVKDKYNLNPEKMDEVLADIEKVTKRMVVSIVKEDFSLFTDCLDNNQALLDDLGIVSKKTQKMIKSLSKYGVGKVTGAGGVKDGSGLILFAVKDTKYISELSKKYSLFKIEQDLEGVRKVN